MQGKFQTYSDYKVMDDMVPDQFDTIKWPIRERSQPKGHFPRAA